ncbi:MAG: hypothetical protein JXA96_15960 [Sedimentisphaerales bacterium]|nr:hypothetical protein [Sedimentisphaerales bacterium]
MSYDPFFDTEENQALTAICTRKFISSVGVGGIIFGILNLIVGLIAIQATMLNIGIVILGAMMLITGIYARKKPAFEVLQAETIVAGLLFLWNLGIAILNSMVGETFNGRGLIFSLIVAIGLYRYYHRLGYLREQIESVEPEKIEQTKQMCKMLSKTKLKEEPTVIQSTNRQCRVQFMNQKGLFIQRNMMHAFTATKEEIYLAIKNPYIKSFTLEFNHPTGKLIYKFNKKNSEKLKTWLSSESSQTEDSKETIQEVSPSQPEPVLCNHNM